MITRKRLNVATSIRYSWKNILFSLICAGAAYVLHLYLGRGNLYVPTEVVSVLGVALAIILAFRNSSAYDRWWEARKIWGGIVNESRSFTRQALTILDPKEVPKEHWDNCVRIVRSQIAWVNALKLQLREVKDKKIWDEQVGKFLRPEDYDYIMSKQNHVTHLGMLQGYAIKELQAHETMDIFSYIQMDDTLTRITDLQGRAERIKSTPLPRPYDYYTLAFLNIFILTFPFAFMEIFRKIDAVELIFPITVIIGWIFYQIYVFGYVMSHPFANWKTDVALDSITNTIEIDLVEAIGEKDIPEKLKPSKGFLN